MYPMGIISHISFSFFYIFVLSNWSYSKFPICIIIQVSAYTVNDSNKSTGVSGSFVPRKRLGKNSFLLKQEMKEQITNDCQYQRNKNGFDDSSSLNPYSPSHIRELAIENATKKPGSKGQKKSWRHWLNLSISTIRLDLYNNIATPADRAQFENLFFRLGVAADKGKMPCFDDKGARSGYALEFFCRSRNLAELFFDALDPTLSFANFWVEGITETPILGGNHIKGADRCSGKKQTQLDDNECTSNTVNESRPPFNIVSLGGGPGFDYVSCALAATFSASGSKKLSSPIHATIFDYEEGWEDLVNSMNTCTRNVLKYAPEQMNCSWGGKCDITKPLSHPSNSKTLLPLLFSSPSSQELVDSTDCYAGNKSSIDMFICQYCVAENSNLLKQSNFIFFKELFEVSSDNALFIFTETSPHLWPDFYELLVEHCPYMQMTFNQNGRQMLLRNGRNEGQNNEGNKIKIKSKSINIVTNKQKSTVELTKQDTVLVEKFRMIALKRKIKEERGYERQRIKDRGRR